MSNISDYVTSLTDLSEAVRLAAPTDGVRLLMSLASYNPTALGVTQTANILALRVANIASLGTALSEMAPTTSDEAQSILNLVIILFDGIITDTSDAGMYNTSEELKTLKTNVVNYLENFVLTAPALTVVNYNTSLPAAVIAYALYRNAGRADELILENNPQNPLFMPNVIKALSN